MKRITLLVTTLALLLAACSGATPASNGTATTPGMGMGRQSGMMARHHAPIPEEYAGLRSPVAADESSLERGAELFATHCATCHGDGGMGDGVAGAALDPMPAPIAQTSQMMSDDYLYWRISEGGAHEPFSSAMPKWKEVLDETARWDLINYVRALGSGTVQPRQGTGGAVFDSTVQATRQAEVMAAAVEQQVVTQAEADTFAEVQAAVEALRAQSTAAMTGSMDAMQEQLLATLVQAGTITQGQADVFSDVHTRLMEAGLME